MTIEELKQVPQGTNLLCISTHRNWPTVAGLLSEIIHNGSGGYGIQVFAANGHCHRCWLCYYEITLAPQ